jgi:hypothetical protein
MEDLREWAKFAVWAFGILIAVFTAVWRLLTRPILDQLNGFGQRVKRNEESYKELEGRVLHVERDHERFEFRQSVDSERMGKTEALNEKISNSIEGIRAAIHAADRNTESRLASIEAKMDIGIALKESIEDFSTVVERAVDNLKR